MRRLIGIVGSMSVALAACSSSETAATSSIPTHTPEFITVRGQAPGSTRSVDIADPRFEHLDGDSGESVIGASVASAFYDSENEYMIVWLNGSFSDGELPIFEFCKVPDSFWSEFSAASGDASALKAIWDTEINGKTYFHCRSGDAPEY